MLLDNALLRVKVAAPALMLATLALVQPRPRVAGLDTPGDDAARRISETP